MRRTRLGARALRESGSIRHRPSSPDLPETRRPGGPEGAGPDDRSPAKWHGLRVFLSWLVRLRGSPEAIALGVATGTFVAFTPTIGIQTFLALVLATLVGGNRPACLAPVWITNPVTIPPIFAFTYWLGSHFGSGPPPGAVARMLGETVKRLGAGDYLGMHEEILVFAALGRDVFVPLWIGGAIVGGVAAAVAYGLTLRAVHGFRSRRRHRRHPDDA